MYIHETFTEGCLGKKRLANAFPGLRIDIDRSLYSVCCVPTFWGFDIYTLL